MGKLSKRLLAQEITVTLPEPYDETGLVCRRLTVEEFHRFSNEAISLADEAAKLIADGEGESYRVMFGLGVKRAEQARELIETCHKGFVGFDGTLAEFVALMAGDLNQLVTLCEKIMVANRLGFPEKKVSNEPRTSSENSGSGTPPAGETPESTTAILAGTLASQSSAGAVTPPAKSTASPPAPALESVSAPSPTAPAARY